MIDSKRVTVISRAHGDGRFLNETILSVLSQKHLGQFIVVLDKPSDKLLRICEGYKSNPIIQFIQLDRSNLSRAMNVGISNATNDYISVIDSDDMMLPDKLSIQLEFLSKNLNFPVVGTNFYEINKVGEKIRYVEMPRIIKLNDIDRRTPCPIAHSTVMFRKNLILEIGGYSEKYEWVEDIELWFRVNKKFEMYNIQVPLINYRIHDAQSTSTNFHKISKALVAAKIENGIIYRKQNGLLSSLNNVEDFYKTKNINLILMYYVYLEVLALKLNSYRKQNKWIKFYITNVLRKILNFF
jgi:glycosyltransferase involved in cell wall biosynthesis